MGLGLAAGLGLIALSGEAAPAVPNRTFDTDVEGWAPVDLGPGVTGTIEWEAADAESSPASGSAKLVNTSDAGTTRKDFQACATGVTGGGQYRVGFAIFISREQPRRGGGEIGLSWYGSTDCSGTAIASIQANTFTTDTQESWLSVVDEVAAPAGAQSVGLRLGVEKYEADVDAGEDPAADFAVLFDNVELVELSPPTATTTSSPSITTTASPTVTVTVTPPPGGLIRRATALELARDSEAR
jgi:hypothetical protein